MSLNRQERITHHRKAPKTSSGVGPPNPNEGNNGDVSFRSVKDSGTVQYLKKNGQWIPISASGTMPAVRIIKSGGGGGASGSFTGNSISSHDELVGLGDDDHEQYVHISTVRTISASHAFTGTPTFTNGTFTSIDINGGTIDGTAISADSTQTEWDAAYTHSQVDGGDSVHVSTAENTQWDTAYTHSQIAGGDSVHVSTTENTQWDAAYTHSLDSSQAHSDYLVNNANDVTSGTLQINGTLVLATGSITDSSGAITFGNENLTTTGTLNSGEITVADGGGINLQEDITFTGATLENRIKFPDNIASALLIGQGTAPYVAFNSVNGSEQVIFVKNVNANLNVVIDGNLDVDGISNLDNTDIDGTLKVDGTAISLDATSTFNIDNTNTTNGVTINTATSGGRISIGHSTSETTVNDNLNVTGIVDITNTTDSSNDSGDTGALRVEGGASIAKKLYVGTDLDVDGVSNLDVVDIDGTVQVDNDTTTVDSSGAITFTAGASSRWDTTGSLTLDTSDDMNFDAASGFIKMKKQGATRLKYELDSTPKIISTGDFTLDGSGSITADSTLSFVVRVANQQTIRSDYSTGFLYLKDYDGNNLWDANHYAINSAAQFNHFTTGYGDLYQNFSILCKQTIPNSYEDYIT